MAVPAGGRSPVEAAALYGPVAGDLPLVDAKLASLAEVEAPWLREMLGAVLAGGGKRMRPAVALLAGRFGRYEAGRLVPLAASVELLHTATLVHDDVIDASPERRGRPTAAALFQNGPSVMLGDYMFAYAADFVAETGNIRAIRAFAKTLRVMATGELEQDLSAFEYSEDVQRYFDRIAGKTASLFATAAEGGAVVAGAGEPSVEALRRYGQRLGMAFQIVDDVLDFSGDAEALGKPVASDLRAGTLTLPAILYLQRQPDDNPVRRAFDGVRPRANVERAVAAIREGGLLEETMEVARRFAGEALAALEAAPAEAADSATRETLAGLVSEVIERRS